MITKADLNINNNTFNFIEEARLADVAISKTDTKITFKRWQEQHERWQRKSLGKANIQDDEIIQKAIQYINQFGGRCIFSKGVYYVNDLNIIKSGVSLVGIVPGNITTKTGVIIKVKNSVKIGDGINRISNVNIENISFEGYGNNDGLILDKLSSSKICNVKLHNFETALKVIEGWNIYYDNLSVGYSGNITNEKPAILLDGGNTETNHQIFVGLQGGRCEYAFLETTNSCPRNHLIAPSFELPKDGITNGIVLNDGASFRIVGGDILARGKYGIFLDTEAYAEITNMHIDCNGGLYGIFNKSLKNAGVIGVEIYDAANAGIYNSGKLCVIGGRIYGTGSSVRGIYNYNGNLRINGTEITYFANEGLLSFEGKVFASKLRVTDAYPCVKFDTVSYATLKSSTIGIDETLNAGTLLEVRNSDKVIIKDIETYGNISEYVSIPVANKVLFIENVEGYYSKQFNKSGVSVTLGQGAFGSAVSVNPRAGFITNFNLKLYFTVAAGDAVIAKITSVFESAGETTGITKEVDNSTGTSAVNQTIELTEDDKKQLIVDGDTMLNINVYGESVNSNANSALSFDCWGSS